MDKASDIAAQIVADKNQISLGIAGKVGEPITDEDVAILIEFAAQLFDHELSFAPEYDYSEFRMYSDDDLPNFVPVKTGKGGRKPKRPVRGFLKHFFPIVEYMMSSTHGRIEDRVGFKGQNKKLLTYDEKFQALNQIGKLAFLIAQQFYPDITIDGKAVRGGLDGDVRALLYPDPKQFPYYLTPNEIQQKKKKPDENIRKIVEKLGPASIWAMVEKHPDRLADIRKWLERNQPR